MKKKIFSIALLFAFLIPCMVLFSACGKIKDLNEKTLVFAKVEVEGSVSEEDYVNLYKAHTFKFGEKQVEFTDGVNEDVYDYKLENSKLYVKDTLDETYPEDPLAEISGSYMILSQTVEGGVVKIYFKVK